MRASLVMLAVVFLAACSQIDQAPQIRGSETVIQPGVTFVAPAGKAWSVLVHSTYQIAIRADGGTADETWVVVVSVQKIRATSSPEDFLALVKAGRSDEPNTGRFEIIRNDERLYSGRSEVCVKHETESKDFGAKRGGDYSTIQYFGMNCIHPQVSTVAVLVELSRKAPAGTYASEFSTLGSQLLNSVSFVPFH